MILKMHANLLPIFLQPFSQTGGSKIIQVFSGTIPDATSAFVFSNAAYAAQKLVEFVGPYLPYSAFTISSGDPVPVKATATKTGTASWFAIVGDVSSTSPQDRVLMGTITNDPATNHPLLLNTLDIVQGQQITLIDFNFKMAS